VLRARASAPARLPRRVAPVLRYMLRYAARHALSFLPSDIACALFIAEAWSGNVAAFIERMPTSCHVQEISRTAELHTAMMRMAITAEMDVIGCRPLIRGRRENEPAAGKKRRRAADSLMSKSCAASAESRERQPATTLSNQEVWILRRWAGPRDPSTRTAVRRCCARVSMSSVFCHA